MKTFLKVLFITLPCLFLFSSCGVMFGGSKFIGSVIVKDHPDAKIYVNGASVGQGTAIGRYPRNKPLIVELKQEGCEPKTETFYNTFRTGSFIMTFLTWGLLGALVDVATGASYKPDHKFNPAIEKLDMKNFVFTVDYSGCPAKK